MRKFIPVIAVFAIATIGITPAVFADDFVYTFVRNDSPDKVNTFIDISGGYPLFVWNYNATQQYPSADVTIQGQIQALTANDIINDNTRFTDTTSIEKDVTGLTFSIFGQDHCLWVSEDYNDDNKWDTKRLVCF